MKQIVFVTGGARSGKSRFAQGLVEGWQGPLLYVATGEARDDEMRERIEAHQRDRGERWQTLEEPRNLAGALARASGRAVLVDCLTLWASNLMEEAQDDAAAPERRLDELAAALDAFHGRLCLVTNEVGLGIVPENALARRYRDWAGRVNQRVAAAATEAWLVVSGLPLRLR